MTLNNYHAQPVCSPTRASVLSGRHVIHHGIYMPFEQGSAYRLNLSYSLIPSLLRPLGYATHAVRLREKCVRVSSSWRAACYL